jgi:ankyrin repeat protein
VGILSSLLERGAAVVPYSKLALEFAGHLDRTDLAEMLLAHGADTRQVCIVPFLRSDLTLAKWMVAQGTDVNQEAYGGWPPIVYVSRGDKGEHPERVAALLQYGADVDARGPREPHGTALHCAAKAGYTRVIHVLLQAGANVHVRTDDGTTPLRAAMRAKRSEVVATLRRHGAIE